MADTHLSIIITMTDGTRRTVSHHEKLAEAAHIAFQLAKDLSEHHSPYDAREIAILDGGHLHLSIAIARGVPL